MLLNQLWGYNFLVWCIVSSMLEVDASLTVASGSFVENGYNIVLELSLTVVTGYFVDGCDVHDPEEFLTVANDCCVDDGYDSLEEA